MRLDQYIWSHNPRGLHVQRALITPLDYSRWTEPRFGWVKLVAAEHEYVDDAMDFLARGITPIVRLYVERPGAMPFNARLRDLTLQYVRAGVRWFEFYNEPNLPIEWQPGAWIDWQNFDGMIRPLMDNWMIWAEFVAGLGCYPGFTALAESAAPDSSSVRWMDAFLNYLSRAYFDRFATLLNGGLYCATHPYILNHFYQEIPGHGPTSARPPEAQNAREPGWHFEYPYDPISQRTDPGRTVYGGTAKTPHGDPTGLLAMGQMFNERCASIWGSQAVPVVGTEGGIFPFNEEAFYQQDNRYPAYSRDSQAEATIALFEWSAAQAPPWFFGLCLWKEDEYYQLGPVRAIERLRETPPLFKTVPPLEVMKAPNGPGPVHGEPDLHAIILAPGLAPDWFFDTARAYWNRFRPLVATGWDFIEYIPNSRSLAATVIAPPDVVQSISEALQKQYPNVVLDVIVADGDPGSVASVLNARVWSERRLG